MTVLVGLSIFTGCTINTVARTPEPNIVGTQATGGTFKIDVSSVPEHEVCSQQGGLKDFCVSHFQTAVGGGLEKVLAVYVDSKKPGPAFSARFKLVQFSHSVTSGGAADAGGPTVKVTLRWQFEMFDETGKPVVQLAETTDGPEQLNNVDSADEAVEALLSAVMEQIAAGMRSATWASEGPEPAPSPASTAEN